MTKITSVTSATARTLSEAVIEALKDSGIEEKYGVTVSDKGGSYADSYLTMKLEVAVEGEGNELAGKDAENFKRYAFRYDLSESDLGRIFWDTTSMEQWKIIGCKPRSTKYPILVENVKTGKVYKFPANRVKRALTLEETA